jgi:hypothetical protein
MHRGDPMLIVRLNGVKRAHFRCAACAKASGYGEPPADLPPLQERSAVVPMLKIGHVGAGALPLDWKARSSGEREPGEDDE